MKIAQYILEGRSRLMGAQIQCADPLLHMKQIAEFILKMDTSELYRRWDEELNDAQLRDFDVFLERRIKGEPFQYIVGYEWFWKSRFHVGPGVFIPRRETEFLVEAFLSKESRTGVKVGELGAGTGNIGISVLGEQPGIEWHAFEITAESLPYLRKNSEELLPNSESYFIHEGDFFQGAGEYAPFDWMISNPPYVARTEFPLLAKEIRHEPKAALAGGEKGLDIIEKWVECAVRWLKPGGSILFEMATEHESDARALLQRSGFGEITLYDDYAGLPRAFYATLSAV